jgi:hypothetical protein
MASGSRLPWRLSAALWAERRVPALARRLRPSPVVAGETGPHGTVYRGVGSGPLVVVVGNPGAPPDWLGSALATALGGAAVVLRDPADGSGTSDADPDPEARRMRLAELLSLTVADAARLGADPDRVAVLGAGAGAAAALTAVSAATIQPLVRRLVLLAPTTAPRIELVGIPPAFLQSSPQSPTLGVSRSLEIDLRKAGVAVRPVEYAGLPDAWVTYPRFAPGSKRAVEDIVAFLRRGFGLDGTFSGVIPGWDLK